MKKSLKKSLKQIKTIIPEWMQRFDENNGGLNFEFAISRKDLEETMIILNSFHSKCGNWFALTCQTCKERYGEDTIHFSLVHNNYGDHISRASKILARTNYRRN